MRVLMRGGERLMGMDDETWARHANPWSVWTRLLTPLPLLALAVWSRVWIGTWALLPVSAALAWIWLNPRLFPPPARLDSWSARGVLGERIWLRRPEAVATHHIAPVRALTVLSALGMLPFAWGLWALDPWATLLGIVMIAGFKAWFVDRMAWLWDDFARAGGTVADLRADARAPSA
ncbi:DUF6653 family protein [Rubellimicrobium sp. CFH 75288]|uniref:DUF6653 family protein n=1 Tax=Rubellimicrobium sp. CFH 75288 TaxID=2697034 RepID=UPI0014121243|nr:DUF6653 family protein [Rubellimicrobium sp. CFH 75288]NAZ36513.1 hypothetical protein [Rubellimicrobium sp. CFH 75288]